MDPCLRCGSFVRPEERVLRDLAFCRECLDAPPAALARPWAPRSVLRQSLVGLSVALVLSIATGAQVARGLADDGLGLALGAASFFPWGFLGLWARNKTNDEIAWRSHLGTRHELSTLEREPVLGLLHGRDPLQMGLLFESAEGFAFFGTDGARTVTRFAELDEVRYRRDLFFIPKVRMKRGGTILAFSPFRNAPGREWAQGFVARVERARTAKAS